MKKHRQIENRELIERKLTNIYGMCQLIGGYTRITEIVNKKFSDQKMEPVTQDAVYRMITKLQIPGEYIAWSTIEAAKEFLKEVREKLPESI